MSAIVTETKLDLPLVARGKVRDIYDLGDRLLIVATDRISAFDVVLPTGIPDKGRVLTQMSAFWFERTGEIVPNHFLAVVEDTRADGVPIELPRDLIGRAMVVRKAERIDVECVVRGYITGSGWASPRFLVSIHSSGFCSLKPALPWPREWRRWRCCRGGPRRRQSCDARSRDP